MKPFLSLFFAVLINTSYLFAMDPPKKQFVDYNLINKAELTTKLIALKSENLESWFRHHASPLYVDLAEQEKKDEILFLLRVANVVAASKKKNKKKPIDEVMHQALRKYYIKFIETKSGLSELLGGCHSDMKQIDPNFVPTIKKSKKKKSEESTELLINDGQSETPSSERFAQAMIVLCQTYFNEIDQLDSIKNSKISK